MRRFAVFALVVMLASPVAAQGGRLRQVAAPTASEAGLRGASAPAIQEPAPAQLDFSVKDRPTSLPAGLAFTRPLTSTASTGAGSSTASQCRTRCAQSRYFCLAEAEEETCSPQWARCVAGCS